MHFVRKKYFDGQESVILESFYEYGKRRGVFPVDELEASLNTSGIHEKEQRRTAAVAWIAKRHEANKKCVAAMKEYNGFVTGASHDESKNSY